MFGGRPLGFGFLLILDPILCEKYQNQALKEFKSTVKKIMQ